MKIKSALLLTVIMIISSMSQSNAAEKRCGWFHNPTPSNAWLIDRDAEWIISYQGGHQAEGDWPEFTESQWIKTNIHYAYGCACITAEVDHKTRYVKRILKANALDLSVCRKDKALKEK